MAKTKEEKLLAREQRLDVRNAELIKKQQMYNKEIRNLVKERTILDMQKEMIMSGKTYTGKVITPKVYKGDKNSRLDILVADVHYKGKTDDKRVEAFISRQLSVVKEQWQSGMKVRLAFLGDDIEGELHVNSHDKHQEEITVKQVIGVQKHYTNFITSVSAIVGASNVEVAFVPESNHGQLRFHGMQRGDAPRNDVGYIILDALMNNCPKAVKFWKPTKGYVETNDTFYMHGDKGYMKSADKLWLHFGTEKHLVMGHWHSFKLSTRGDRFLICAPKASPNVETYSEEAGYPESPAAALFITKNRKGDFTRFELSEVK